MQNHSATVATSSADHLHDGGQQSADESETFILVEDPHQIAYKSQQVEIVHWLYFDSTPGGDKNTKWAKKEFL